MSESWTFAVFESSSGAKIHRIPLEVFPHFWAYVYIVQNGDYCVLVDAGSGTEASHENLLSGFQKAGVQPFDLTYILLTHGDIDHFGGLSKLRPLTAAKIGVHEFDLQTVAHHEANLALIGRRLAAFLAETGLSEETREQILSLYRFPKAIYQSVPVDFTYKTIDMHLGPFEFVHLPGHSPGHVAIRVDDVIFCGDLVVEGVTPHLSPQSVNPFSGLDHYLESLSHLQDWAKAARLIFNGHDDVIADLPTQIELTKQNILRRMSKAIDALQESLTIAEVCKAVYGEMNGYNQLLVIEKTGAYVEYLYQHGLIEITNPEELERGGTARYRRLREEQVILDELEKSVERYTGTKVQT
jgi:glyoxylase-like metal-dependent hydrolase (beta-lactamase superfamily II)